MLSGQIVELCRRSVRGSKGIVGAAIQPSGSASSVAKIN
jgi:hypothetical protein